jgi:WD40 repeat protein
MIVTGSWDSDVRLWDVATGKELAVLTGHKASVLNCAFSRDGRTLATKSDDRTIKLWNLATLREVASIPLDYTGNIQGNFLAFSPDGQILIANDSGPGLRCWRAATLAEIDSAEIKRPVDR